MKKHSVDLSFLDEMLKQRSFSSKWLNKIHSLIHGGSMGINISYQNNDFFIMVAEVFSKMLIRAAN
jgi:hypothetical protein